MTQSNSAIFDMNAEKLKRIVETVGGRIEKENGTVHVIMGDNSKMQSLLNEIINGYKINAKQVIPGKKDFNDDLIYKRDNVKKQRPGLKF